MRARIVLAIAETKEAYRRHPIGPEVRNLSPNEAKCEGGPEGRVAALQARATRAARKPGGRAALLFDLGCADLTKKEVEGHFKTDRAALLFDLGCADLTKKEVEGHFKTDTKKIINTGRCASTCPCQHS